jgi:hypothetical protein
MRRAAMVLLSLTPPALAQALVSAGELPRVQGLFESRPGAGPLPCEVTPLPPSLNFALRYRAGYTFHVPQSQSQGSTRGWSVLTAITPEGGAATYLFARTPLSSATRVDASFNVGGLYFLGTGRYSVEAAIRDDRNRICRKQWQIVVGSSRADRAVPLVLPPQTVQPFSPIVSPDTQHQDHAAPMRLSVLLNAAAFSTVRTNIRPYDRAVLLGALTALLEHLPAESVRLVVFSLEQQREVYRSEHFAPAGMNQAADAIRSLQQATVDVRVLQKPLGHIDFLAGLIGRERGAPNPADTIVFLGPTSRYGNKIPESALPAPSEAGTRFFYVRYESPRHPYRAPGIPGILSADTGPSGGTVGSATPNMTPAESASAPRLPSSTGNGGIGSGRGHTSSPPPPSPLPPLEGQTDIISAAVARFKGKTLTIQRPADLAKAIRKIEQKTVKPPMNADKRR